MRWLVAHSALLVLVLIPMGCSREEISMAESDRAGRQMELAETLEAKSLWREAAREYALVAEHYPSSPELPRAARKAGLLYASPLNPARDDSTALHWLRTYLALPESEPEREMLQAMVGMLEECDSLTTQVTRLRAESDSLYALAKRHSALLHGQADRLRELEESLRKTSAELEKLKAIDLRTSRGRKNP